MISLRSRGRISVSPSPTRRCSPEPDKSAKTRPSVHRVFCLIPTLCLLFVTPLAVYYFTTKRNFSPGLPRLAKRSDFDRQERLQDVNTYTAPPSDPPSLVPVVYRDFLATVSNQDPASSRSWPPRIDRIPTSYAKYLLPGYIGEQESKARIHLADLLQLSKMLGRTLVLPNVSDSRLGMCRQHDFALYYATEGLENVERLDEFLWLAQDEDRMDAQLVTVGKNAKQTVPQCLPNFDIREGLLTLDTKSADHLVDVLKTVTVDVLLVNWDNRHPFFADSAVPLQYSPSLVQLAAKLAPSRPYVMVHWRMETVSPSGLLSCAQSLVETILDIGIRTVWLATDYPYTLARGDHKVIKSSTFRDFGPAHKQAIASLIAHPDIEVVDLLGRIGTTDVDMGVMGILDKLVGVDADVFLAGGPGCGRSSSFTKQIVQGRQDRWLESEHMLNGVQMFTPRTLHT